MLLIFTTTQSKLPYMSVEEVIVTTLGFISNDLTMIQRFVCFCYGMTCLCMVTHCCLAPFEKSPWITVPLLPTRWCWSPCSALSNHEARSDCWPHVKCCHLFPPELIRSSGMSMTILQGHPPDNLWTVLSCLFECNNCWGQICYMSEDRHKPGEKTP